MKELRHVGLFADIVIGRTTNKLTPENKQKIAMFSGLPIERIFGANDVGHLLEVIHVLEDQDISRIILNKIKMPIRKPKLGPSFIKITLKTTSK